MANPNKFNIRVYGLLINKKAEVLVTDEIHFGVKMTKFPGGGLKIGEGTIDCLKREFWEEMQLSVDITEHFYTTDFYQETALIPEVQQLISIYYKVKPVGVISLKISEKPFDFDEDREGMQSFRWIKIKNIKESYFSFPIDKKVGMMLKNNYDINL